MVKYCTALLFPILLISCVSSTSVVTSGNIWLGMTKKSFCNAFISTSLKEDPCFGFSNIDSKTSYEIISNDFRDRYFVFSPSESNLEDRGESKLELITGSLSEAAYFSSNKQKRVSSSKDRSFRTINYDNGSYEGEFNSKGERDGKGIYKWNDGGVYEGDFKNGGREGYGKINLIDGSSYEGNWVKNKKEGQGTYTFKDGRYLEGIWKEDNIDPNKIAKFFYEKGYYLGYFVPQENQLREGTIGTWVWNSGHKYTARVVSTDDSRTYPGGIQESGTKGKGTLSYDNGDLAEGIFNDGNLEEGTYTLKNGGFITGTWKDNKPVGRAKGKIISDTGFYEGEFVDGKYEGEGTWFSKEGKILHQGTFKENMLIDGKSVYENGDFYVGQFKGTKRHGKGIYTYKNGEVLDGEWEEGEIIQEDFLGIGVGLVEDDTSVYIDNIVKNGPADKSGKLFPKTRIYSIKNKNGYMQRVRTVEEAVKLLKDNEDNLEAEMQISSFFSSNKRTVKITKEIIQSGMFSEIPKEEARLALVIGNKDYKTSPLDNTVSDAQSMKEVLEEVGFEVILKTNVDEDEFKIALWEFGDKIEELGSNTSALFFYSGHALQVAGKNYLIPIGARIKNQRDVEIESIEADEVMAALNRASQGIKIAILDACRNNPYKTWTKDFSTGLGLAEMRSPMGTIIAFSTAPGKLARDDGFDGNSVYTGHLVENIKVPGLAIETVFKRTRTQVYEFTEQEQQPWENTSLMSEFYFIEN